MWVPSYRVVLPDCFCFGGVARIVTIVSGRWSYIEFINTVVSLAGLGIVEDNHFGSCRCHQGVVVVVDAVYRCTLRWMG